MAESYGMCISIVRTSRWPFTLSRRRVDGVRQYRGFPERRCKSPFGVHGVPECHPEEKTLRDRARPPRLPIHSRGHAHRLPEVGFFFTACVDEISIEIHFACAFLAEHIHEECVVTLAIYRATGLPVGPQGKIRYVVGANNVCDS